jgi:hypothetical protein
MEAYIFKYIGCRSVIATSIVDLYDSIPAFWGYKIVVFLAENFLDTVTVHFAVGPIGKNNHFVLNDEISIVDLLNECFVLKLRFAKLGSSGPYLLFELAIMVQELLFMHVLKKITVAGYRVSEATVDLINAIAEFFCGYLFGQERKGDATVDFKRLLNIRETKSGSETKAGDLIDELVEVFIIFLNNHMIVGIVGFGDSPLKFFKGSF